MTLYCSDVEPAVGCCTSCHEDEAEGYILLEDYALTDGTEAHVCCTVANVLAIAGRLA